MMTRLAMWDFDRTLARGWLLSEVTAAILDETRPGLAVVKQHLSAQLRSGFPWHTPEEPHLEMNDPSEWWRSIEALISGVLVSNGIEAAEAGQLCSRDPSRLPRPCGRPPVPDVRDALETLSSEGWPCELIRCVPAEAAQEPRSPQSEACLPIDERVVEIDQEQAVVSRHGTPTLPATRTAPRRVTPRRSR